MMVEEMRPCPFCNGRAILHDRYKYGTTYGSTPAKAYWIACANCLVTQPERLSVKRAVEAWNKRIKE